MNITLFLQIIGTFFGMISVIYGVVELRFWGVGIGVILIALVVSSVI